LRGSAIVKNALRPFNDKERQAQRLRMDGRSDRQISKETGISQRSLEGIFQSIDSALETAWGKWVDKGFTLSDLQQVDEAGNRFDLDEIMDENGVLRAPVAPGQLSAEEKKKRLAAIMGAMQPTDQARNTGAIKRWRSQDPKQPYGFDPANPYHAQQAAKAVASIDSGFFDMEHEYWINSLLSGPATHVANISGNIGNVAWEYGPQRFVEALLNVGVNDPAAASFSEYGVMMGYAKQAFGDAWHHAKMVYDTEVSLFEGQQGTFGNTSAARGLQGDNNPRHAIKGKLGRLVRVPTRALMFMDEFFKRFVGRIEAAAQAHRIGIAKGYTGDQLKRYIRTQVALPGSSAWQLAVRKAKEMVFQQDLPEWIRKLDEAKSAKTTSAGGAVAKLILRKVFPFVKTPWNIFATALRKSPLGTLRMFAKGSTAAWQAHYSKDMTFLDSYTKADLIRDTAEQALGWLAFMAVAGMAEGDPDDDEKLILLTGTRGRDDQSGERELLNRSRGGETTLLINGKPVFNYGRYEPFATTISTMVNTVRNFKKVGRGETVNDATWGALGDLAGSTRSKTFLAGWDSFMQTMNQIGDGERVTTSMAKYLVTGAVPNLIRQPARNMDDTARDTRNAALWYHALPIPALAQPLYNIYGEPVKKGDTALSRIVMAEPTAMKETQPVDTALNRWNTVNPLERYFPSNPDAAMFRYKDAAGVWHTMTPEQIARFRQQAGRDFAAEARSVFANPKAPTEAEMEKLQSLRRTSFSATKKRMFGGGALPVTRPF
jgi:hypothetical protein